MIKRLTIFVLIIHIFTGCEKKQGENQKNIAIPSENIPEKQPSKPLTLKIIRIEQEMFASKTYENIENVLHKYPSFSIDFLKINEYPSESVLVKSMLELIKNPSIDTIYQTCKEVYGDFYSTGISFENAFENIKAHFKDFSYPVIYTVITGMGNDMYVNDSMIVIGLEFFLAEKSKYKPTFPTYILRRYRTEYIVPHVLMLISNRYNQTDYIDNSMIAEMVYYGKSYYFLEKIAPTLHDTLITGYSEAQLKEVNTHVNIIWEHFVNKKLFFETKHEIVTKYTGERPSVLEIGSKCPGRIGRWLGWQIVRVYMKKHPKLSLAQLMAETDAKKIFYESKYKPEL